jgi:hypothetical protein
MNRVNAHVDRRLQSDAVSLRRAVNARTEMKSVEACAGAREQDQRHGSGGLDASKHAGFDGNRARREKRAADSITTFMKLSCEHHDVLEAICRSADATTPGEAVAERDAGPARIPGQTTLIESRDARHF